MKILLRCLVLSGLCGTLQAEPDPHASHGVHGMVLLQAGEQLIASHLPLLAGKHAHQIVLQVELVLPVEAKNALAARQLITLEPEPFALADLQQGQLSRFHAKLVLGHFERGGTALGQVEVKVNQLLLDKAVGLQSEPVLYRIPLQHGELLVNAILGPGDSDQIWYWYQGRTHPLYQESADFVVQP